MASSRIFVKGLPPTFTEAEFKKHFSQNREVTDVKIFPNRRIGYVGYKTPEDAQKAVKYFNKTFIRMSRIGVEVARPVQNFESGKRDGSAPTARRTSNEVVADENNALKRKRESNEDDAQDPKLKEFMQVMKPRSKKKAWDDGGVNVPIQVGVQQEEDIAAAVVEDQSDEEYELVPKKTKKAKLETETRASEAQEDPVKPIESPSGDVSIELGLAEAQAATHQPDQLTTTDSDWARSRTSRLLGLLDEDEEEAAAQKLERDELVSSDEDHEPEKSLVEGHRKVQTESSIPMALVDEVATSPTEHIFSADSESVHSSMRLFVRNLPYDVKEEDLEAQFRSYGNLEEVSGHIKSSSQIYYTMNT